jgi:hypothetical protein
MSIPEKSAVIIFNHALNQQAIELKNRFKGKVDVYLFDSGSEIGEEERHHFDKSFENIYYNGLLNYTNEFLKEHGYEIGMIITSDVGIGDVDVFLKKTFNAFKDEKVGAYAPSATYSYHRHMNYGKDKGLQQVSYTEGFCFAFRTEVMDAMCPVDLSLNKFGYGTDSILGFHALDLGYISVVDYTFFVDHPYGSGYDKHEAVRAKHAWLASLPKAQQRFYKLVSKSILKNRLGAFLADLFFRNKR